MAYLLPVNTDKRQKEETCTEIIPRNICGFCRAKASYSYLGAGRNPEVLRYNMYTAKLFKPLQQIVFHYLCFCIPNLKILYNTQIFFFNFQLKNIFHRWCKYTIIQNNINEMLVFTKVERNLNDFIRFVLGNPKFKRKKP